MTRPAQNPSAEPSSEQLQQSLTSVIACGREQVHEATRRIAVARIVKRDVEIGCRAEQMQQRPEREAVTAIGRETEVDLNPLNAGVSRVLRHLGQIACSEIAEEQIVEVRREKFSGRPVAWECDGIPWTFQSGMGPLAD